MSRRSTLIERLNTVDAQQFDALALLLFQYQYRNNLVYRSWVDHIGASPDEVSDISQIPFLPISAFKHHLVSSDGASSLTTVFESSGTTGDSVSRHAVYDMELYLSQAEKTFESFYGPSARYCILALLPSYLERSSSSLVAMVDRLISRSSYGSSGFYLYDHDDLRTQLIKNNAANVPTILFGVSFALLDLLEGGNIAFPDLIVMETGGMKGRREEMTKAQLQEVLCAGFEVDAVHSEYGMTELFSQAYSSGGGRFRCGDTMRVYAHEVTDPMEKVPSGRSGVLNIIDLANIDSCAFIETQDMGVIHEDGSFDIIGRLDQADIRGCNLMVSDL